MDAPQRFTVVTKSTVYTAYEVPAASWEEARDRLNEGRFEGVAPGEETFEEDHRVIRVENEDGFDLYKAPTADAVGARALLMHFVTSWRRAVEAEDGDPEGEISGADAVDWCLAFYDKCVEALRHVDAPPENGHAQTWYTAAVERLRAFVALAGRFDAAGSQHELNEAVEGFLAYAAETEDWLAVARRSPLDLADEPAPEVRYRCKTCQELVDADDCQDHLARHYPGAWVIDAGDLLESFEEVNVVRYRCKTCDAVVDGADRRAHLAEMHHDGAWGFEQAQVEECFDEVIVDDGDEEGEDA
jgi:hypothetical protein